ncbi:hypothetical protein [Herbiconiux sp. L3-i23]|uniref:hypothetical protein n=1 Tax=Herbiconiux sp. L3-i23 TaxID=2905871 RepID=UPI002064444A|nr:hypothetical protein [Herbiconiux sp. L3-i23]BDI22922.1 hypothetical protein L3i23_16980 [Herbiconiux sp. L3-i23]
MTDNLTTTTGGRATIFDMLGRWHLVATTNGYFTFPQRVDRAEFVFEPPANGRIRFTIEFELRGRSRTIRASTPARVSEDGNYRWRGRGALLLASRSGWSFAVTSDGAVAALRNPGSMVAEAGTLIVRRDEAAPAGVRRRISEEYPRLGLTRQELTELAWR